MKTINADTSNDGLLTPSVSILFSQHYQFWLLQTFGWCGYALVLFLAIIQPQINTLGFNFSGQLSNLCLETLAGFLLSYLQWIIVRRIVRYRLKWTLALSFLSSAILGFAWNVIKLISFKVVVYQQVWHEHWDMLEFGGWLLFSVATMFVWNAIFFIMLYNRKLQQEHELLLRARTSEKEAQLQMMRYQLNPHFMFNTMNAISTLIYRNDNERANEMLEKLCTFLRHSLEYQSDKHSRLKREIEMAQLYLSIEKVRFSERLNIKVLVPKEILIAHVPSLVLQPVLDNAVKHGIESRSEAGEIVIRGWRKGDTLMLEVTDSGSHSVDHKIGFGIGLNNTRERIKTLFNGEGSVKLRKNNDGSTSVTLVMPFYDGLQGELVE